MKRTSIILALVALATVPAGAQERLTLEDCRQMAVQSSKDLDQARTAIEMAGYDRKIALANYFPDISATGAYLYNNRDIALINDQWSSLLTGAGTALQGTVDGVYGLAAQSLTTARDQILAGLAAQMQANPELARQLMTNPEFAALLQKFQQLDPSSILVSPDVGGPINAIGQEIDDAFHPDLHNIWVGAVTLQQPVFVGGKIVYSNKMAALAEELAKSKYDMKYADVVIDVDQAYWQIVSIANKKRLAESYADLLHRLEQDVETSVAAGVMTSSDALQIKVKANEADMLLTKSTNGLQLAKMLLCKRVGLPLDSAVTLADEDMEIIPVPGAADDKTLDAIYADRPETRSLDLASQIYDAKAKVARADLMPTVALVGSWMVSNPNVYNGFQNTWQGGMLSAGVMVRVPLFHGLEQVNKYKKAKAEATLYRDQYDDAKEMIGLQVTQQRHLMDEALEKLTMAESSLQSAEENLRTATLGFEAGVIPTNTVLQAQTGWLSAHSEYIDAGIELQMAYANLQKAEGNYSTAE